MRAVNLIPSEQRSGGTVGARSGGAAFLVLGLLAGLAVLALLYGSAHHQLQSRRVEAATLAARAQQVQAQAAQLAPYAAFMALREQRLHAIAQLVGARFDWSTAMGELSRVLPSGVSLSSLTGAVSSASAASSGASSSSSSPAGARAASTAAAVSSATPPGATPAFTLSGCATSQAIVAEMLVRLRLMSGVSSVALQSSTKSGSSSGGSSSGGSCPSGAPVFSVQVTYEPLPAAATPSIGALTATASASGSAARPGVRHTAASNSAGGSR